MLKPVSSQDAIVADSFSPSKCVCHGQENSPKDFFYVYTRPFTDLHIITLPFEDFMMEVLKILNVIPTQLHHNSWTAL